MSLLPYILAYSSQHLAISCVGLFLIQILDVRQTLPQSIRIKTPSLSNENETVGVGIYGIQKKEQEAKRQDAEDLEVSALTPENCACFVRIRCRFSEILSNCFVVFYLFWPIGFRPCGCRCFGLRSIGCTLFNSMYTFDLTFIALYCR